MDQSNQTRILIVDDEVSVRRYLEVGLADAGFAVVSATDIESATDLLSKSSFDIVLADKNLKGESGIDLARAIALIAPDTKTIIMTAKADVHSAVEALRLGVADYISKPIDLVALETRIAQITEYQRLQRKTRSLMRELEALTVRDPLTRLFNHAYLRDVLYREIARSDRNKLEFGLLLVGIDHFKQLNQHHGHNLGDDLMKLLGQKLAPQGWGLADNSWLRRQDVAARFGDDRFAILLPETNKRGATSKAAMLCSQVADTDFDDHGLPKLTVSIGVASYPDDATEAGDIIEAATLALRAAKKAGRNQAVAISGALAERDTGELKAEELARIVGLGDTIRDSLVNFVYQPIVHIDGTNVFGYEALCRPAHRSFPDPLSLIDTAEKAGKMIELGRVLRRGSVGAIDDLPNKAILFVNLHPHEISDAEFASIEPTLAPWADRIVFEITESAAIRDFDRLRKLMRRLRKRGFRFALDDLGAGYSGLHSLAQLEPDFVKLDRSLVTAVERDERVARLVRHIVDFSTSEGLNVIAEGIETHGQFEAVKSLGCDLAQGYLFGRPSPVPKG